MLRAVFACLVVLAFAAPAFADKTPRQEAADLAARSARHYKAGEFEQAAALLAEAYAKFPEPNLLYNLARARESLGDRAGAIEAYEKFLATAKKIEDRAGIERRLATLKSELAEQQRLEKEAQQKPKEAPPPTPPPTPIVVAPREQPEQPSEPITPPRKTSKAPWIAITAGAMVVGAGFYMGYRARNTRERADDAMSGTEAQKLHDEAKRDALAANILFGVGGATAIVGVVLAW